MPLRFSKMHGAGNDFVVLDRRDVPTPLSAEQIRRLCDRHRGIGCDQLLTVEPPRSAEAVLAYGIWNTDGSAAAQCGNGARCIAAWAQRNGLLTDGGWMDSPSGTVQARCVDDQFEIDMGRPEFDPAAAGFLEPTTRPRIAFDGQDWPFTVVSMGNPHAVLRVADADRAPVHELGAALQRDRRFHDSCNVGFAEAIGRQHLRLRVYERGVGETLACGSGACAAVAALIHSGVLDREVAVELPGGVLSVHWPDDASSIRMRGPAEFVFEGVMEL